MYYLKKNYVEKKESKLIEITNNLYNKNFIDTFNFALIKWSIRIFFQCSLYVKT